MAISVRSVDVEQDRNEIISTLSRYLVGMDEQRYEWLYRNNPFGQARAWLAIESPGGPIGAAASFPRPMLLSGRQQLGCVLGDFCISERHRSLGPALELHRKCVAGTRTGEYAFCYDFPSQPMMAVYKRLNMNCSRRLLRLAKPLRIPSVRLADASARRKARVAASVGDFLFRSLQPRPTSSFRFDEHLGPYGKEFTTLAAEMGRQYTLCTFRSAKYLNWRYKDHPLRKHRVLTARTSAGELAGYVIFYLERARGTIVDFATGGSPDLMQGLLLSVAERVRSEGAAMLEFPVTPGSACIPVARRIGFFIRKGSSLILYAGQGEFDLVPDKTLLVAGDRES